MLGGRLWAAALVILAGTTANAKRTPVSVPFVGCRSDGQTGPVKASNGKSPVVPIEGELAHRLAYYSSEEGFGVLAPRGWYCFGTYGSGGNWLYVSPEPVDTRNLFSDNWQGLTGPAIQLSYSYGGTSGRFTVADIIARVFPAYKAFVTDVSKDVVPPDSFSFGPYPKDTLTYKSKSVVEYITPAETDGLGTRTELKKNDHPIEGVAILVERTPDLLLLAVRLPPELAGLSPTIIHEIERDAEHRPQPDDVR
jgi:hypothetical protein